MLIVRAKHSAAVSAAVIDIKSTRLAPDAGRGPVSAEPTNDKQMPLFVDVVHTCQ